MTKAIHGNGTLFQQGDGADPEVFTTIAEITNIGGPNLQAEQVEVTSHDSEGWREYVAGLRDGGEISIEGNFVPSDATHTQMIDDFNSGSENNYRIILPDGEDDATSSKWEFAAICTGLEFTHPADGVLGFSATYKLTGQPVLTPKS